MIEAVEQDLDGQASVHMLKIDGGMTANKLFNQLQANALGKPIVCSKMAEISGWGAAVAAGIGVRQISLEQFRDHRNQQMEQYKPNNTEKARQAEFSRWREALKRAQGWAPVN
jgi:glycerol kinase